MKGLGDAVPVRAVSRAIAVLQYINRGGSPTIKEVAEGTGLPYATVFRMVMTLAHEGMIEADSQKCYRPTELVWSLVSGFQNSNQLVSIAKPMLSEFTSEHLWPVALSVRVGNRMMVKHSTTTLTTQTFTNYYPGYTLPLLECAAGKVYLAFCSPDEAEIIRKSVEHFPEDNSGWGAELANSDYFIAKVRSDGFATHARNLHNDTPGKTSAISVPVLVDGVVRSTLTMIYFEKAMSLTEVANTFAQPLKQAAARIARALQTD